jgi:transketolase
MQTLDQIFVNTIRFLADDAVVEAHSGHPGLPLCGGPMGYVICDRYLRPVWPERSPRARITFIFCSTDGIRSRV